MPRWSNFDIRCKCGTVSKALRKSNMMTSVCLPWSMLKARSSTVSSSWDSQDHFWRNPCCTSVITSCFSQWFMIQCSISLQQTEVKDTGRWFDGDERSRGGGQWPRKGVWGCAAVMTPFFQASRRSLAYQFTIIVPLLCPPFSNFRKIFNFQPCFGQNFSSQDANFPNFRSLDPSFFKENPLPRPYFWKPVWHIPTPKKVECPPPPPRWAVSFFE